MPENKISAVLGAEYDHALWSRVIKYFEINGVYIGNDDLCIGGSQEYECYDVGIFGVDIRVERETYIGITVSGSESVVRKIAEAVK